MISKTPSPCPAARVASSASVPRSRQQVVKASQPCNMASDAASCCLLSACSLLPHSLMFSSPLCGHVQMSGRRSSRESSDKAASGASWGALMEDQPSGGSDRSRSRRQVCCLA